MKRLGINLASWAATSVVASGAISLVELPRFDGYLNLYTYVLNMRLRFPIPDTYPSNRMKSSNEGIPRDLPSGKWLLGMGEDGFIVPNYSFLYARI